MAVALTQLNPSIKRGHKGFFFLCLIASYVLLLTKCFVIDKKHRQKAVNNADF